MDSSNVIDIITGLKEQSYVLTGSQIAPGIYCRHILTNQVFLLNGDALVEVINGLLASPEVPATAAWPTRIEAGYIWHCAADIRHVTREERTRILRARHPQIVDLYQAAMATRLVYGSANSNSFDVRVVQMRRVEGWAWGLPDSNNSCIAWYTFPQEPGFHA